MDHYHTLLDDHIASLNPKFRDKFAIKQSLYDNIVLVLQEGWGDAQFKFWVHKNFKLIKVDNQNIVYDIKSDRPVVTHENLYAAIQECHGRVGHHGRDKTWREVSID